MDFHPRMEEPSKPSPSAKASSVNSAIGTVKCCQVPKVSTNFTSAILAPCLRAVSNTLFRVLMNGLFLCLLLRIKSPPAGKTQAGADLKLNGFVAGSLRANANGGFDVADEDLAVADLAGAGGANNGLCGLVQQRVGQDHFDLDFGQKINGVFAPAIVSVWPFWRPKPLTSETVKPCTPTAPRASLTSSSLKGLMIASIFFMGIVIRDPDTNNRAPGVNRNLKKSAKKGSFF